MIKKLRAYLYKSSKSSMQSGNAFNHIWVLEFKISPHQYIDPVMNWVGSNDMQSEIKLIFDSLEQAQHYLTQQGIDVEMLVPHHRNLIPKSYSDNFKNTHLE